MTHSEMQEKRDSFLEAVYDIGNQSSNGYVSSDEIEKQLGLDFDGVNRIAQYLSQSGLITLEADEGLYKITHAGTNAVESGKKSRPEPTGTAVISDEMAQVLTAIVDRARMGGKGTAPSIDLLNIDFDRTDIEWVLPLLQSAMDSKLIRDISFPSRPSVYKLTQKGKLELEKFRAKVIGVAMSGGGDLHVHTNAQGNAQVSVLNNSPHAQQSMTLTSNDLTNFWPLVQQLITELEDSKLDAESLSPVLAELRSLTALKESPEPNKGIIQAIWGSVQGQLAKLAVDSIPAISGLLPQISAFFSLGTAT